MYQLSHVSSVPAITVCIQERHHNVWGFKHPYPPNLHESFTYEAVRPSRRPRRGSLRRHTSLKTAACDSADNQKRRRPSSWNSRLPVPALATPPFALLAACPSKGGYPSHRSAQVIPSPTLRCTCYASATQQPLKSRCTSSVSYSSISTTLACARAHKTRTHGTYILTCTLTRSMHQLAQIDKSGLDTFSDV